MKNITRSFLFFLARLFKSAGSALMSIAYLIK